MNQVEEDPPKPTTTYRYSKGDSLLHKLRKIFRQSPSVEIGNQTIGPLEVMKILVL